METGTKSKEVDEYASGERIGETSELAGSGSALFIYQLMGSGGPALLEGKRARLYRKKVGYHIDYEAAQLPFRLLNVENWLHMRLKLTPLGRARRNMCNDHYFDQKLILLCRFLFFSS